MAQGFDNLTVSDLFTAVQAPGIAAVAVLGAGGIPLTPHFGVSGMIVGVHRQRYILHLTGTGLVNEALLAASTGPVFDVALCNAGGSLGGMVGHVMTQSLKDFLLRGLAAQAGMMSQALFRAGGSRVLDPLIPIVAQSRSHQRRQLQCTGSIAVILAALGAVPILYGTIVRAGGGHSVMMDHVVGVIQLGNLHALLGILADGALLMLHAGAFLGGLSVDYPLEVMSGHIRLAAAVAGVPMIFRVTGPILAVVVALGGQNGVRLCDLLGAGLIAEELAAAGAGPILDVAVFLVGRLHAIMVPAVVAQGIDNGDRINGVAILIQHLAAGIAGVVHLAARLSAGSGNCRMLRFRGVGACNGQRGSGYRRILPVLVAALENIRCDQKGLQAKRIRSCRRVCRDGEGDVADVVRLVVVRGEGHPRDLAAADLETGQVLRRDSGSFDAAFLDDVGLKGVQGNLLIDLDGDDDGLFLIGHIDSRLVQLSREDGPSVVAFVGGQCRHAERNAQQCHQQQCQQSLAQVFHAVIFLSVIFQHAFRVYWTVLHGWKLPLTTSRRRCW